MKINVTANHIDSGIKCDSGACPVALALQEAFPDKKWIYVDMWKMQIGGYHTEPPESVSEFIDKFDNPYQDPKWLEPFDFELDYEPEEA